MLHFLSVPAEPHLEKAGDVWCVRLSEQNSNTAHVLDCATAGREKINWKAGLDGTEIFTDLCVGNMDPDNKD